MLRTRDTLVYPYLRAMRAGWGNTLYPAPWKQTRLELLWVSRAFVRASLRGGETLAVCVPVLNKVLHGLGYDYAPGRDLEGWEVGDDVDRVGVQAFC